MIELNKKDGTMMLVWNTYEMHAVERSVLCKIEGTLKPYITYKGSCYKHAKPIPEPKEMTSVDAMWWAGIRKVGRHSNSINGHYFDIRTMDSNDNLKGYKWNELIRENGETNLKYKEWKEFTFENCKMD